MLRTITVIAKTVAKKIVMVNAASDIRKANIEASPPINRTTSKRPSRSGILLGMVPSSSSASSFFQQSAESITQRPESAQPLPGGSAPCCHENRRTPFPLMENRTAGPVQVCHIEDTRRASSCTIQVNPVVGQGQRPPSVNPLNARDMRHTPFRLLRNHREGLVCAACTGDIAPVVHAWFLHKTHPASWATRISSRMGPDFSSFRLLNGLLNLLRDGYPFIF